MIDLKTLSEPLYICIYKVIDLIVATWWLKNFSENMIDWNKKKVEVNRYEKEITLNRLILIGHVHSIQLGHIYM